LARLFALDQNFPEPIVASLNEYIVEAELVPVRRIDQQLAEIEDWQVLLALHHHERAWDGLITTDSGMLKAVLEGAWKAAMADGGEDGSPTGTLDALCSPFGYQQRTTAKPSAL
jgi:hypothetical protein